MKEVDIKRNIDLIRGKLRENYTDLTDEDLRYDDGQENQFFDRLERRTGKTRDSLITQFKTWNLQ